MKYVTCDSSPGSYYGHTKISFLYYGKFPDTIAHCMRPLYKSVGQIFSKINMKVQGDFKFISYELQNIVLYSFNM